MNDMSLDSPRRRLRAPRDNRGVLFDPPFDRAPHYFSQNRELAAGYTSDLVTRLRRAARDHLVDHAQRYSRTYRDGASLPSRSGPDVGILLTGHQPELFHPGVWFKNFALAELASRVDALPIHLIVDNDLCHTAALRVPLGPADNPRLQTIPYDAATIAMPHEQRSIRDFDCFSTFADRVARAVRDLISNPLLASHWAAACEPVTGPDTIAARLSRMRHKLEASMGLETLELPLSSVCDGEPFFCFLADLICRFDQWHSTYNRAIEEFRARNRIRSATHPVPCLARRENWYELPLWMWSDDAPARRRVYVRLHGHQLEMTDLDSDSGVTAIGRAGDEQGIADRLSRWRKQGTKLRPRALVTTLYARLFLCDLFLHGIGGAKYDELTDVLIETLYQVKPPAFTVATLSLHLPIKHEHIPVARVAELKQRLRCLQYHPESCLTPDQTSRDKVSFWIAQKKRWISAQPARGHRKPRHDGITEANSALSTHLKAEIQEVNRRLRQLSQRLSLQTILESREHSYCLFPEKFIQNALFDCLSSGA